jgi:hypothetical protein
MRVPYLFFFGVVVLATLKEKDFGVRGAQETGAEAE